VVVGGLVLLAGCSGVSADVTVGATRTIPTNTTARSADPPTTAPRHTTTSTRPTTVSLTTAEAAVAAGTFIEQFNQPDGPLENGWSVDGTNLPIEVIDRHGSTKGSTEPFVSFKRHGLDLTSGVFELSFDGFTSLVVGGGGISVLLLDSSNFAGYGLFVGNAMHVQRWNPGGTRDNITNDGRPEEGSGSAGARFTLTRDADGTFREYLDGKPYGSVTDTVRSPGDVVVISIYHSSSPTVETTIDNLRIQDFITTRSA
jgi:hypothetical protein